MFCGKEVLISSECLRYVDVGRHRLSWYIPCARNLVRTHTHTRPNMTCTDGVPMAAVRTFSPNRIDLFIQLFDTLLFVLFLPLMGCTHTYTHSTCMHWRRLGACSAASISCYVSQETNGAHRRWRWRVIIRVRWKQTFPPSRTLEESVQVEGGKEQQKI